MNNYGVLSYDKNWLERQDTVDGATLVLSTTILALMKNDQVKRFISRSRFSSAGIVDEVSAKIGVKYFKGVG